MPRTLLVLRVLLFALFVGLLTTAAQASPNPAQYPLRVHVFQRSEQTHHHHGILEYVDGNGRANLYEQGAPQGFDFAFRCSDRLMTSSGYETYPAKWKKKGQSLEILTPILGKPGATESCELKVDLKDFAYFRHAGSLYTEPQANFKQWMDKHDYDPEHDKNEPTRLSAAPADPEPTTPPIAPIPPPPAPPADTPQ